MMNLPAAAAAPAPSAAAGAANAAKAPAAATAGLPPPAANAGLQPRSADAAKPADAGTEACITGNLAGAVLGAAAQAVPGPFGAILGALADAADAVAAADASSADEGKPSKQDASADDHAAAAAVATMLPAMGIPPLAMTPGATPGSVAAVAAALTSAANAPSAGDSLLLRRQAQASILAAREASAEAAKSPAASTLDARSAMLAAAARPLPGANPQASVPVQPGNSRPAASEALSAALNALQGGQAADSSAAPVAAKDSASLLADSQRQPGDASALPGFRSVLANTAASQSGDALHLSGNPEQWQQPLRAALGDRLQLQLARNDDRAVIRLEPPNMGSVEISVRHTGGALQVNIAASHSEVLRQLNTIGDAVRQDLSQRQLGEVAVTVSSSNARSLADGGQQQRQQQSGQQRQPGRALEDGDAGTTTFAMLGERE